MALGRGLSRDGSDEEILISGGGDGTIKLWNLDGDNGGAIEEIATLENGDNSVLTVALDGTFLYSGLLEGDINVWDLDTRQLVRSVKAHAEDVLTLTIGGGFILSGGAGGWTKVKCPY
jgi:di- and tripeptidase